MRVTIREGDWLHAIQISVHFQICRVSSVASFRNPFFKGRISFKGVYHFLLRGHRAQDRVAGILSSTRHGWTNMQPVAYPSPTTTCVLTHLNCACVCRVQVSSDAFR